MTEQALASAERSLQTTATSAARTLQQHPEWTRDALALRDRLDEMIDEALTDSEIRASANAWRKRWFGQ